MITVVTQEIAVTTVTAQGLVTAKVAATTMLTTVANPGPQGPPGGVPEAPLTGGPYGRQAGAWTLVMSPLLYDPAGVRANCFNLANQSGNLDGGVFT